MTFTSEQSNGPAVIIAIAGCFFWILGFCFFAICCERLHNVVTLRLRDGLTAGYSSVLIRLVDLVLLLLPVLLRLLVILLVLLVLVLPVMVL